MSNRTVKKLVFGAAIAAVCMSAGSAGASAAEKTAVTPGIYEICSAEDQEFILDLPWCTETEQPAGSGSLQMYRSLDINQQKFYLEQLPDLGYRITGLASGDVLTVEAGEFLTADMSETADGSEKTSAEKAVTMERLDAETRTEALDTQTWYFEKIGGSNYYIRSESGAYLTRTESSVFNGETLRAAERTGKKNQRWILKKTWISDTDHADTDYINPYAQDGRSEMLSLVMYFGEEKEEITSDMLASWIRPDSHRAEMDQDQLRAYVQKLAEKYDTVGQPKNFTTSYGNTITLYKGDFGWKMNVDATVEALAACLDGRRPKSVEPVWKQKAGSLKRGNDIGESYVEVDLVNQKVWLYQNGEKILETDCVTGTYGTDRQTPGGVYDINGKQSPAVLRGPGYASPVSYWMPFNGGIGLHDATWRSTFGGDIFRSNGSHGCVNLPLDAAETIYETISIGYPVVCYN